MDRDRWIVTGESWGASFEDEAVRARVKKNRRKADAKEVHRKRFVVFRLGVAWWVTNEMLGDECEAEMTCW